MAAPNSLLSPIGWGKRCWCKSSDRANLQALLSLLQHLYPNAALERIEGKHVHGWGTLLQQTSLFATERIVVILEGQKLSTQALSALRRQPPQPHTMLLVWYVAEASQPGGRQLPPPALLLDMDSWQEPQKRQWLELWATQVYGKPLTAAAATKWLSYNLSLADMAQQMALLALVASEAKSIDVACVERFIDDELDTQNHLVYALLDGLGQYHAGQLLKQLAAIFTTPVNAIGLVTMLAQRLRGLLYVHTEQDLNALQVPVWSQGKLRQQAQRLSIQQLSQVLDQLMLVEMQIKSNLPIDDELLVANALLELAVHSSPSQ